MSHERIRLAVLQGDDARVARLVARIGSGAPDIDVVRVSSTWSELTGGGVPAAQVLLLHCETNDPRSVEDHVRAARAEGTHVIVVTSFDNPRAVTGYMAAGADAVLHLNAPSHRVVEQVRLTVERARLIREREDRE